VSEQKQHVEAIQKRKFFNSLFLLGAECWAEWTNFEDTRVKQRHMAQMWHKGTGIRGQTNDQALRLEDTKGQTNGQASIETGCMQSGLGL
jgi:hypothetical protein